MNDATAATTKAVLVEDQFFNFPFHPKKVKPMKLDRQNWSSNAERCKF